MMSRIWQIAISVGVLCAAGASTALAQWSSDPANTFQVGNTPGDNSIPQVVADSNGGSYVLWRSWGSGTNGYATRVQRLDANGNELWPHNGVQVAPGTSTSTIVGGADIAVCPDGSGVVVFCDTSSDPTSPGVRQGNIQKISPSGALLWNSGTAIPVTSGANGGTPGHICATPDGGCIVADTITPPSTVGAAYISVLRYTSSGTVATTWNNSTRNPAYIYASGVPLIVTCVQPGDPYPITGSSPGAFIVSWLRSQTQSGFSTQKFTGTGAIYAGWGTVGIGVALDSHGLTQFQFPTFLPDTNGGGVYAWQSYANSGFGSPSDALLQHVLSNGTLKFATPISNVNDAAVGTNIGRYSAALDYNPTEDSCFVASEQGTAAGGETTNVIVQKIDTNGNLLYTPFGFTVVPEASNPQITANYVHVVATNDGGCMVFGDVSRGFSTLNAVVYGAKVALSGGFPTAVWSNIINTDTTTSKGRLSTIKAVGGAHDGDAIVAFSWPLNGGTGNVIAATEVSNATGAPGVVPVPASITTDLPPNTNACDNDTITLSVTVAGTPNVVYSWQREYAATSGAWWTLSDGDDAYSCIIPEDGTTYTGTNTATLTIHNVHALPLTLTCNNGSTVNPDEANNQYQCVVYNAGSDLVVTSSPTTINIICQAGVCCQSDGSCTLAVSGSPPTCSSGTVVVSGTCSPNTCPAPSTGTCCNGSTCATGVAASACTGVNTLFTSGGTTCNASGNHKTPCCEADFNHVGGITVQDIFDFLSAWFAKNPNANITNNGAGAPTVQSIFDFLSAWFAKGC